jgi:hypothetical protein
MIRRSVVTGLLVGLAFVLVLLYPTFSLYVYPRVLHMAELTRPGGIRTVLLFLHWVVGVILLGLVGSLAAWRGNVRSAGDGFKSGAISGLVVGLAVYIVVVAPTVGLLATGRLWTHPPTLQEPYPPNPVLLRYINDTTRGLYQPLALCLVVGGLLGAVEGALVGFLLRGRANARASLLDVIDDAQPRRRWFADDDDVWRAGIIAGLIAGDVMWLSLTMSFLSDLKVEWPQLQEVLGQRSTLISRVLFSEALLNCLLPVLILAVLGTGALSVLLLKDPPRRHWSRFKAVVIAGVVASVPIFLAVAQFVRFWSGLARYFALSFVQQARPVNPTGEYVLDPQLLALVRGFVRWPALSLPLFYVVPLLLFLVVLVVVLLWLAPQAVFYGLVLPLVFKRPVDRAARIVRALRRQPNGLLPQVYGLFGRDARALRVLPHLALALEGSAAARVVAAYHTLGAESGEMEHAVSVIRQATIEERAWRWRAEVGELYRVLQEGLAARTLDQVTAIEALPQEVTSSLPVLLAKSCEGIGRVLGELKKVQRVDDLGTKTIFLNSAQAALLDLHRYIDRESGSDGSRGATLYPEIGVLHSLLDRWQGYVLTATQNLQGRADLRAELGAHEAAYAPKVRQCVLVTNQGLNVAQNIRLHVAGGEGYEVIAGAAQVIDILGPQESRELEFWLAPDGPRRLRLVWQIVYDDSVDTRRQVEFADAMVLEQEGSDRPFQRIFPIPYVTGTPLRSGEMFVGREDVFEFVREHLLGVYQNNVLVLHGQRRTGKTSILYRLREVLADTHVAVLVDMQGKAARGTSDFLYALSDDMVYALENASIPVVLPDRSEYEKAPEFTFRSRFFPSVVQGLDGQHLPERGGGGSRNLLLMFDEFEELQRRVEEGRLEPEIFAFFRNLMQHEPRLDFLFSGTHKLEELGAGYWSILFNIAVYKRITFLDPTEVHRLVTEPVLHYGMEYDPLAVQRIVQVTAGHPYFVQVICHEMVVFHNETKRNYITVSCVDQVLERIIERGEAHFKYIWTGATVDEQWVMLALTDLLPDADATANPAQIAEELSRKGCDLMGEPLSRALAQLWAKDILSRSGPQSSLYRFNIDLIRRWVGITRPRVATMV